MRGFVRIVVGTLGAVVEAGCIDLLRVEKFVVVLPSR